MDYGGYACSVDYLIGGQSTGVDRNVLSGRLCLGRERELAILCAVADKKRLGEEDMVGSSYRISRSWVHRRYYGVSGEVVVDL